MRKLSLETMVKSKPRNGAGRIWYPSQLYCKICVVPHTNPVGKGENRIHLGGKIYSEFISGKWALKIFHYRGAWVAQSLSVCLQLRS